VLVPLQVIWARTDPHRASGTSLAAILPIAAVAAATYYLAAGTPQADVTVALWLAAGGTLGSLAGALAARRISDAGLRMIVAIVLAAVGGAELYDVVVGTAPHLAGSSVAVLGARDYAVVAAGGLVVGVVSGLTGVGGGILVVPLLTLGFGIGQRVAQGTSLIAILPTAAIGAFTHYRAGYVDVRAAAWMTVAAVPAALVGAALALSVPPRALGALFAVLLLFAAIRTWPWRRAIRRA
jgi:uncharacterized membrane protein YfcA